VTVAPAPSAAVSKRLRLMLFKLFTPASSVLLKIFMATSYFPYSVRRQKSPYLKKYADDNRNDYGVMLQANIRKHKLSAVGVE
jgi:hypothetical protein